MNALILSSVLMAAAPTSKVDSVVVYPDRAQVVRVASVACGPRSQAVFEHLPPAADVNSFRAKAVGGQVAGMRVETRTREEDFSAELTSLKSQLHKLELQLAAIDDERQRAYTTATVGGQYAEVALQLVGREMAAPQPNPKAWAGAFDVALSARMSAAAKVAELDSQSRELGVKMDELRRKIAQLSAAAQRKEYLAEVLVSCPSGSAKVELSYLVGGASWSPSYEARADEGANTVDLTTYATLQQTTGEDWSQAKMTLSTAVPSQNATPPQLQPLQVYAEEKDEKKVLVRRDEKVKHAQAGAQQGQGGKQQLKAFGQGLSVQLEIPQRSSVPGDGTPARLMVGTTKMKGRFAYRTVPKLMPFVFRVADLVNAAPYPLLAGPVDAFRANGFIGRYSLDRVAEGAVFQLTFGVEEQLRVERIPVEEVKRDAGLFSGKKRFKFAYRFEFANYARRPYQVELAEHIPVSELEDVQVAIDPKTTSGYQLQKDDGILTWKLSLKPMDKQKVELAFHVDVPDSYDSEGL